MGALVTQSSLNAQLDEKKEQDLSLDLPENLAQNIDKTPQISVFDDEEYKNSLLNYQSSDDDKYFALALGEELESALKQGYSKKDIIAGLKKSDIFADDERNLRALDELTNSDDERLFDDILDYANSFKPKSEVDLKGQTLAALEAEKEALRSGGVPFGDTLEAKRYAELNKQIDELKFKREYEVKKQDSDKLDENASLLQKVAYYTNPVNLFSESTIGKALGGAADYAEKITIEKVFDNIQPQNENEAKIDENIRSFIYQAQNRGEKINAGILNEAETERLIKVAAFLGDDIDKAMISEKLYKMNDRQKNALIEKGLKFYEKEANIAQKDFNDLNDEEKDYILKKEGFLNRGWNALFNDDDTTIKEGLAKIKSGALGHILSEEVEAAKNFATQYNILHTGTNWLSGKLGANSEEESQRVREKFEQNLLNISDKIKADGVKISDETGKIYFFKNQDDGSVKYFEINEGFFDNFSTLLLNNKAAILGGIGGTILGVNQAKKGRFNRLGKGLSQTGGAIVGSFLGSTAGAVGDYFTYLQESGEDFDFDTFAWHATQEGILSLAADAVAIGAGKVLEKANIQGVKNAFGKITDYTPVVGFVKRAFSGNSQAVDKLIKQTYTDEQLSALKAFGESFGAELKLGEQSTKLSDDIALKFGEQHPFTKAAKTTYDIFSLPTQKEKQEAMLQAIRADETGNLIGFLIEVANSSPQLQVSMRNILNQTTMRIKNQLDNLGLKQGEIKEVFDEFEKGIKDGYEKAMSEILGKVYDDNFKTTISRQNYDNFRIELENSGILQESDLKFLNFVEKSIYNPSGVSFTQLNNALKNLNALFKETSPSFQTYTKNKVQGFLRDEIKAGIDDIFSQNKVFYQDAQALFSTALSDYANMKEISKTLKKLKVRDESRTFEKALDDLVKYTQGQGLNDLSNLTKLTKNLSPDDAARVELSLLNYLFNQSLLSIKSGEKIVLEVFDSGKFLENLAKIGGEFNSLAARDFIDIINAFHKLYKNDIQIAQNLRAATTQRVGSSIATTIEGAVKFQIVRELFSQIIRLMPHIPFAKALNEKISGAALRFHLKSALKKSNSIGELKQTLNHSIQRGNFNSKTKELLTKINSEISQAQAEILEKEAFENTIAQNAKGDMQLYNTLKAYEVENLDLATPQTYEKFIDDILSEDLEKLQKAPNILYIADLNADLSQSLGLERAKIFLRKNDLHHFRPARKGEYKQDLNKDEFLEIPQALAQAKRAYIDPNNQNFFITFKDKADENKLNFLHINKDEQGNYIITAKKADIKTINNYKEVSAEGLAPTIPQGVKHSQEPSTTLTASTDTIDEIVTKQNLKEADLKKTKAKKSFLDLAKEEAERIRAEKQAQEIVQKEAELKALKETQAKQEAIIKEKEAKAGLNVNEYKLDIGQSIKTKPLRTTQIIINDSTPPFEAEFVIAKKRDIKPNFKRNGLQGRSEKQSKIIENIQSDFKPHLIFEQSGGFEGLPIITRDGQVIAGNHRSEAINALSGSEMKKYKAAAKDKFGIDLADDEVIVRLIKDEASEKDLINLAFMSNVGREQNIGEKALSNLAKFESHIKDLPNFIKADDISQMQNIISKTLDKQGNGLNEFDANLALFSSLSKNSSNNDILEALNQINTLNTDEKAKILKMFVDNAGSFYNIAKDSELKSLDLRPYLNDSLVVSVNSYATRAEDYSKLLSDITHILSLNEHNLKETLKLDKFLFENLKSKILGLSFARFARLENPSGQLFEFLKNAKSNLEDIYSGNLDFGGGIVNKAIGEIDIYDFLKHIITQGRESNTAFEIASKLDDLRAVENKILRFFNQVPSETKMQKEALKQSLQDLKAENIEKRLLSDDELNKLFSQFDNIDNLKEHISTRIDANKRQELFYLLDSTLKDPQISFIKDDKLKYLKKFKDLNNDKEPYFYLLITKDKDKTFVTHFKSRDYEYFTRQIQEADKILTGADIIADLDGRQVGKSLKSATSKEIITQENLNKNKLDDISFNKAHERSIFDDEYKIPPLLGNKFNQFNRTLSLKDDEVFNNLTTFFKRNVVNDLDNELFNKSLQIARDLGARIEFGTNAERSLFNLDKNQATLHPSLESMKNKHLQSLEKGEIELENKRAYLQRLENQKKEFERLKNTQEFKEARKAKKGESFLEVKNQNYEKLIKEAQSEIKRAIENKAYFKKQIKALNEVEATLNQAKKQLDDFGTNPNAKHLKALYKMKNKLIDTQNAMRGGEFSPFISQTKDTLEAIMDAIKNAKENLAVKKANPQAITPTQAFLSFIDETKAKIDYALRFDKDTALKTLDEIAQNYENNVPYLNFIKRKKAEVEEVFKETNAEKLENADFLNTAKIKEIKETILPKLKPLFNQKLTNKDNINAYFNLKSLSKMTSDKAIQKSLDNGFSRAEHIQAVLNIENLYKNSALVKSEPHAKDNNTLIHRFNSDFKNANALITSKESLDKNGNRLYSLELELTPRFNTETPLNNNINEGSLISQKDTKSGLKAEPSIEKTDEDIIPNQAAKNQAKDFEALQKEAQDYLDKRANFKRLKDEAYKAQLKIKELENIQEKINAQKENLELFKKNAQEFKDKFKDDKEARKREGVRIKDKKWRYYIDDYNTKIADYESWIKHFQKELEKAILERQTPQGQKALKEALQVVEDFNKAKAEFEAFDEMPTHLMPDPNDTLNKIIKIHPTQDELVEYFKNFVNGKNLPANKIIKSLFLDGVDYFKRANYPSAYIDFIPKILSDEKLLKEVIGEKFEKNSIKNIEVYKKHISKKESERLDEWAKRIKQYTIKGENNYKAINDDADKKQYSLKNLMTDRYNFQKFFNVIPNKEYGENYAEFYRDGQGAINKLINEAKDYEARKASDRLTTAEKEQGAYKGQVAEAFYRKDLEEMSGTGRIDLVWGDDSFGLKHILDKHEAEFKDIGKEISEIVESGKLVKDDKGRLRVETDNYVVGIKDNWKGEKTHNWIVTAYKKKEGGGSLYTSPHNHTSEILPETSSQIIPNQTAKSKSKEQKQAEKYYFQKEKEVEDFEKAKKLLKPRH